MHRLYLQLYLTLLGILVLFGMLSAGLWLVTERRQPEGDSFAAIAAVAAKVLPPAGAPAGEVEETLTRYQAWLPVDLTVYSSQGALVASVGEHLPPPPAAGGSRWLHPGSRGFDAAVHLQDGRWLMIRWRRGGIHRGLGALVVLALAVAVGAYPLVRRLTRRLERLQRSVDELGEGELASRVAVEGRDEVAALARSFNRAAERIQELVTAQRRTLAYASHELRSPLARMRVALELVSRGDSEEAVARLREEVAELDALIEQLLLASRLDAAEGPERVEEVDLLALAAEEASRHGATVEGASVTVSGDPPMLRRMLRNLLENARRHAGGHEVEVRVERSMEGCARLIVDDRGPGVPEAERERIFEPFHRLGRPAGDGVGVGLGLALVRRIARAHGGAVRCLPRAGGGCRFEVTLGDAPALPRPRGSEERVPR
jgi:signal transduction histidine kinase